MERRPLPADLGDYFSVADTNTAGVHPKRLDAGDLSAPFWGMRAQDAPVTYVERARAAVAVLPAQALFSHQSAARLMGIPLPGRLESCTDLHVTLPRKADRWRHHGFVEHHADRPASDWAGLPVVTPAETWVDLAAVLPVVDLIVAGDHLLRTGRSTQMELRLAVLERRGARGRTRCAAALPQLRGASASPMETRARLAFARWGLPEPELNVDVVDDRGSWIARVDFLWRASWVVGEYYGAVHAASWTNDLTRSAQLEDAGYRVVVLTSRDLGAGEGDLRARLKRLIRG